VLVVVASVVVVGGGPPSPVSLRYNPSALLTTDQSKPDDNPVITIFAGLYAPTTDVYLINGMEFAPPVYALASILILAVVGPIVNLPPKSNTPVPLAPKKKLMTPCICESVGVTSDAAILVPPPTIVIWALLAIYKSKPIDNLAISEIEYFAARYKFLPTLIIDELVCVNTAFVFIIN